MPDNVAFHPKWSIDFTNFGTSGTPIRASVLNERIEFNRTEGEVVWTSESIDISGTPNAKISIDVPDNGGTMEPSDYIRFYYSINGGAEVLFADFTDDIGFDTQATVAGLSGNSLVIIARSNTMGGGAEDYYFDNIVVRCLLYTSPSPRD